MTGGGSVSIGRRNRQLWMDRSEGIRTVRLNGKEKRKSLRVEIQGNTVKAS